MAYLYGEAGAAESAAFERHLGECAACSGELHSFRSVRQELGAWQVAFAPSVKIAPRRGGMEVLRELLGMLPVWAGAGAGAAAAAAVLLAGLAIAGTRVSVGRGGFEVNFGRVARAPVAAAGDERLTRAEAEALVREAVARAQAESREEARGQLAGLEARLNAAHEARLTKVTAQLKAERRAVLARLGQSQPSIREWLFAANEGRDYLGTEDGKSN